MAATKDDLVPTTTNDNGEGTEKPFSADSADLADAIRSEHDMTFKESLRLYPKAIFWSAYVSIGVIMLAFDPQLIGNLYGTPQFKKDFGHLYEDKVHLSSPIVS